MPYQLINLIIRKIIKYSNISIVKHTRIIKFLLFNTLQKETVSTIFITLKYVNANLFLEKKKRSEQNGDELC